MKKVVLCNNGNGVANCFVPDEQYVAFSMFLDEAFRRASSCGGSPQYNVVGSNALRQWRVSFKERHGAEPVVINEVSTKNLQELIEFYDLTGVNIEWFRIEETVTIDEKVYP